MTQKLGEMKKGEVGEIAKLENDAMVRRLRDLGMIEGTHVEVVAEAPFGGDPIVVEVRGTRVSLRRALANLVEVRVK